MVSGIIFHTRYSNFLTLRARAHDNVCPAPVPNSASIFCCCCSRISRTWFFVVFIVVVVVVIYLSTSVSFRLIRLLSSTKSMLPFIDGARLWQSKFFLPLEGSDNSNKPTSSKELFLKSATNLDWTVRNRSSATTPMRPFEPKGRPSSFWGVPSTVSKFQLQKLESKQWLLIWVTIFDVFLYPHKLRCFVIIVAIWIDPDTLQRCLEPGKTSTLVDGCTCGSSNHGSVDKFL